MTRRAEWWVRVQIPLLAAALVWPVVQHPAGVADVWPAALVWPARAAGALMVIASILIFRAASHILGEDLVALPIPRSGGTLRREGVYGRVRHPIYGAIIVGLVGWALLWTSAIGLALSFVCVTFFVFKTRAEERYLRARYPGYQQYEKAVPRFFPRVHRRTLL